MNKNKEKLATSSNDVKKGYLFSGNIYHIAKNGDKSLVFEIPVAKPINIDTFLKETGRFGDFEIEMGEKRYYYSANQKKNAKNNKTETSDRFDKLNASINEIKDDLKTLFKALIVVNEKPNQEKNEVREILIEANILKSTDVAISYLKEITSYEQSLITNTLFKIGLFHFADLTQTFRINKNFDISECEAYYTDDKEMAQIFKNLCNALICWAINDYSPDDLHPLLRPVLEALRSLISKRNKSRSPKPNSQAIKMKKRAEYYEKKFIPKIVNLAYRFKDTIPHFSHRNRQHINSLSAKVFQHLEPDQNGIKPSQQYVKTKIRSFLEELEKFESYLKKDSGHIDLSYIGSPIKNIGSD